MQVQKRRYSRDIKIELMSLLSQKIEATVCVGMSEKGKSEKRKKAMSRMV
jgi:hypothetical protein